MNVREEDSENKGTLVEHLKPLDPGEARRWINRILKNGGSFDLWDHAVEEMEKDDLDMGDANNVLRAGTVLAPECKDGAWRYRVETQRMAFVIEFEDEGTITIITGWRKRQ